jgi:hypothetical protein
MRLNVYSRVAESLDPTKFALRLGIEPFPWQRYVLSPDAGDVMLLCARQSGKSTVIAIKAWHTACYYPGSLVLIIAPSKDQSKELMLKIDALISSDPHGPDTETDSVFEKVFSNGSRIVALPGSERSVRGYSGPKMIIIDEASRTADETYRAVRPMMVGGKSEIVLLSTPFGKRGFFWEEWNRTRWNRVKVVPAVEVRGNVVVPGPIEQEYGVNCFESPRHDLEFLQEELESLGEYWFRQEYMCQFVDVTSSLFTHELIESAFDDSISPLFQDSAYDALSDTIEPLEV